MTQPLVDLVEQFCLYQLKQRGKTEGGVQSYRWVLEQFLTFVKSQQGRVARATDLTVSSIQMWMDEMARGCSQLKKCGYILIFLWSQDEPKDATR